MEREGVTERRRRSRGEWLSRLEAAAAQGEDAAAVKKRLRKEILARRQALDPAQAAQWSGAITRSLLAMPVYRQARTLMVYAAFRGEVDTSGIIRAALAEGKTVALPKVVGEGQMRAHRIERYPDDLVPGTFGIREPAASAPVIDPPELDLVVVPGLAFDPAGGRLGYGGGFYDRYLLSGHVWAAKVAICYSFQVRSDLPLEEHDLRVDWLVTEEGVHPCRPDR